MSAPGNLLGPEGSTNPSGGGGEAGAAASGSPGGGSTGSSGKGGGTGPSTNGAGNGRGNGSGGGLRPEPEKLPASQPVSPAPERRPEPRPEPPASQPEVEPLTPARYRRNPAPDYPAEARRQRQEGVVLLRVTVDARGRVESAEIAQGSGSDLLDDAARKAVRRWEFEPARRGRKAVASTVTVPVRFRLEP